MTGRITEQPLVFFEKMRKCQESHKIVISLDSITLLVSRYVKQNNYNFEFFFLTSLILRTKYKDD